MRKRLPSLNALKAFESVARQLSFTAAARELHVTPGAVSQQVRLLEEHVGSPLFERSRRTVSLTPAGMAILPEVQAGFECFYRAIEGNVRRHGVASLAISVAPSLASKWLLPRLGDFSARFPEIELRISATVGLADFTDEEVDIAIGSGAENTTACSPSGCSARASARCARLPSPAARPAFASRPTFAISRSSTTCRYPTSTRDGRAGSRRRA